MLRTTRIAQSGFRVVWIKRRQVVVEPFTVPRPQADEVLVRIHYTLISPGTERAFFLGLPNAEASFPTTPGYNAVGVVQRVGRKVSGFRPGDRVGVRGSHASHLLYGLDRIWHLPEGLEDESAVGFTLGHIALQGVRKARIELGEPVVVLGLGLVGQLALQLARLQGAMPAVGLDLSAWRCTRAAELGADLTGRPDDPALRQQIAALQGGRGPAVVIEATGFPEVINTALEMVGRGGRVILLGSTRGETPQVNFYRDVHLKGVHVIGAHTTSRPKMESSPTYWTPRDDGDTVLALLAAGRLQFAPLITHRFPGTEAAKAYRLLGRAPEDSLGILLDWRAVGAPLAASR